MTKAKAIAWVADHDDKNDLDRNELVEVFIVLYEAHPGALEREELWEHVSEHPDCQFGKYGRCNGDGREGYAPCCARHESDGYFLLGEMNDHACERCGQYTPGRLAVGGRCPDCLTGGV